MFRAALPLILATAALGQPSRPDPAFDGIPFDDWLKARTERAFQWSLRVSPAALNDYQRLDMTITATISPEEFVKRPAPGQMILLMEIVDPDNHVYRSHRVLSVSARTVLADLRAVKSGETACVLPGDYRIHAAIYDTKSGEHSLKTATQRVPRLPKDDPLRSAWSALPGVELARSCGPRDSSRLSLPLKTQKPLLIDVIATRPVEQRAYEFGPRLDVLAEIEIPNGRMRVTSLDLQQQRSIEQEVLGNRLNRRRLWTRPWGAGLHTINVHALEQKPGGAQFFVSQVQKLLDLPIPEPQHVLIVLSNPRTFPKGEDLRPIQTKSPPGMRVFYIRSDYRQFFGGPPPMSPPPGPGGFSTPPELPSGRPMRNIYEPNNSDSLERTLKPLNPTAFHVTTALQFRNALAAIMTAISAEQ